MVEHSLGHQLARLFEENQRTQFTGKLIACSQTGQHWAVYFLFGRIIWASGGHHRFWRWFRLFAVHLPKIPRHQLPPPDSSASRLWEYSVLCQLLHQRQSLLEPISALINDAVTEVLFEMLQEAVELQQSEHSARRIKKLGSPIAVMRPDQCLKTAYQQWTAWRQAGLISYSPNLAPALRYPEKLREQLPPSTYNKLVILLTGNRSLRSLSVQLRMNLLTLSESLLPFVNQGIIALNPVQDWCPPGGIPASSEGAPPHSSSGNGGHSSIQPQRPLIVGIDDSPAICQMLEKMVLRGGYRFLGVQDSLQALPTIMKYKPDFIFLDLTMPVASGYEVCAQIRRIAAFQSVPVVILSGKDGMVDRVRARLVGASDFLSKPFQTREVLNVINQHLGRAPKSSVEQQAAVS